jgi:hypothetical protein
MSPGLRKLTLTAHVTSSVGWLGAVAGFLPLAVTVLVSRDPQTVRAAYLAMEPIAWYVLVPLSFASFITGLVQALGTPWGLFRHYWVLVKLVINVFATTVLLLWTQTLDSLADLARQTPMSAADLSELRSQTALVHSGGALLLLLTATVLSIYKPKGLTKYGQRQR